MKRDIVHARRSKAEPECLPGATVPPPEKPVFYSLGGLARLLGTHPERAWRAYRYGYIEPAAFVGEDPVFPGEAVEGVRRYIEDIPGRPKGRRGENLAKWIASRAAR